MKEETLNLTAWGTGSSEAVYLSYGRGVIGTAQFLPTG